MDYIKLSLGFKMVGNLLLLSHYFLPYQTAESYLAAKKMGAVEGYNIDVVTMRPFMPVAKDEEFFNLYSNRFRKIIQLEPPAFYSKMPFSRLESLFSLPDSYFFLNWLYLVEGLDFTKYSAIMTWSMPHSIHLVGCHIKKKYPKISWLAHFSDPWVNNPFLKGQKWAAKKINKLMERKVFHGADKLLFTSEETLDLCAQAYTPNIRAKSSVIPHTFDPKLYPAKDINSKDVFRISYVGNFYGDRRPDPFLKAWEILLAQNPQLTRDIEIYFIGASQDKSYLTTLPGVKCIPSVSYQASLAEMVNSDLLLIIDAPFDKSPFLPSKLIDYIGANKPILGITPPGTSQKLIEEMGFLVSHPNNPTEIANKLMKMIQGIKGGDINKIPSHIRERYSVSTVGKQMKDILDQITVSEMQCI